MSNCAYFSGIDLAKNYFSICVVDFNGKVILHMSGPRPNLLTKIANILPMRIGLEACGGTHFLK
ncbi:hypothetical protein INR79_21525 [Vibrio sp. SCSIO 43132]|uniref:hypothetical protein n=1 Tax=Vibrio sp. SCSIO 43132 TaxID=2779363 RepID=UPI001CA85695|nr:hypothetical protein INR79_21525 [Vibrio sp. SCSIO 43132]